MEGYKPYWGVLHKGSLALYYDATLKEAKDTYYMVNAKELITVGKTRMQFVAGSVDAGEPP